MLEADAVDALSILTATEIPSAPPKSSPKHAEGFDAVWGMQRQLAAAESN